jgi:hypothetical protein
MTDAQLKLIRRFAAWTLTKTLLAGAVLFSAVRVIIPDLVNAHSDLLNVAAVVCGLAAVLLTIAFPVSLILSTRRFLNELGDLS